MERIISNSEQDTFELAKKIAADLRPGDVVALYGEMGTGKTAFVKGLAKGLCYDGEVTSPTFSLINEYQGRCKLYHFDMFRVFTQDSLYSTGFYDYLDGDGILAVEWSENIRDELPDIRIDIRFEYGKNENERLITIEKVGEKH